MPGTLEKEMEQDRMDLWIWGLALVQRPQIDLWRAVRVTARTLAPSLEVVRRREETAARQCAQAWATCPEEGWRTSLPMPTWGPR